MKKLIFIGAASLLAATSLALPLRADSVSIGVNVPVEEHHHLTSHEEARLRKEHRAYDRRLNRVRARIDKAEREGRYSAEEARRHREEIDAIRARYQDNADHSVRELTPEERASLEVDLRGRENLVVELDKH